ncbi:MAG: Sua5/YciO/YrdC/YwlC family protein, partial [Firmicutes bacterium]|nr:Sua5/YciO/YrdC/YwlC family protein [Bacillota bacterium]
MTGRPQRRVSWVGTGPLPGSVAAAGAARLAEARSVLPWPGLDPIPWLSWAPEAAWRLAAAFWPGPLTLVLPAARTVSPLVTGSQPTVALRVP